MCRLLDHCRRHRYLSQSGEELALLLSSLLENLLAYRTITHDESPEHRMSCTVNVLVCFLPLPNTVCACTESNYPDKLHDRNCFKSLKLFFPSVEFLQRKEERGHLHPVSWLKI